MGEIRGLGVDLVEVERFGRALGRHPRLLQRLFTEGEVADAGWGPERLGRLAARWAAKEAVSKALGTGIGNVRWADIEVRRESGQPPTVLLHGEARRRAEILGVRRIYVSLAHTRYQALAEAVLES